MRFHALINPRTTDAPYQSGTVLIRPFNAYFWKVGALERSLNLPTLWLNPVNDLERDEDSRVVWRNYYNAFLASHFLPLYPLFDQWIMLQAPSFDCVFKWRREQERKLAASLSPEKAGNLMNDDALRRFIQHYERITQNCLDDLPQTVNHLFNLDGQRRITAYSYRTSDKPQSLVYPGI